MMIFGARSRKIPLIQGAIVEGGTAKIQDAVGEIGRMFHSP
jgi:hypothetical protein